MTRRSAVVGCGAYLPERVLTNHDLAKMVDTSDEWIIQRTGIRERHIAAEGEVTSDLAVAATKRALASCGTKADDVDLIVVATATPDYTFPATATRVQAKLGITRGAAFDIQAVCSGFIYGLNVADNFIRLGQADTALVVGAETFSRILDWKDRSTCVLFGDGAGAVVLKAVEGEGTNRDRGILIVPSPFRRASPRHALCGWRSVVHRHHGPRAHDGQGRVPPCRRQPGRRGGGGTDGQRAWPARHRLACAAPGEPAHSRRHREKAGICRPARW